MIEEEDGRYVIRGAITIANARSLLDESMNLFRNDGPLVVDFSGAEEVDSSAVSLMLEWMRQARRSNRQIRFCKLPANLKSLATLYGVLELIPAE
jgi:phospholipid transport system transporter-binding protein